MKKSTMPDWYENRTSIQCNINAIEKSIISPGKHFKEIISLMPGMSSVELIEEGSEFVTIKTNEGIMKRSNISIVPEEGKIIIEFDEEYQAGKTITTTSHFVEEFTSQNNEVIFQLRINNLKAPGFIGFFYRNFGSKNIGNAFLEAYRTYLEKL